MPKQPVVTIFPRQGDEPEAAARAVKKALMSLGTHVEVVADPLDGLEG